MAVGAGGDGTVRQPGFNAVEAALGLLVAVLVGWLAVSGWRFYMTYLLPVAAAPPTVTPTAIPDPALVREQARRLRQVLDHVGAGIAFRQANQREHAIEQFQAALAIDPQQREARQNLVEMGVLPPEMAVPPPSTPPPAPQPNPTPATAPRP